MFWTTQFTKTQNILEGCDYGLVKYKLMGLIFESSHKSCKLRKKIIHKL